MHIFRTLQEHYQFNAHARKMQVHVGKHACIANIANHVLFAYAWGKRWMERLQGLLGGTSGEERANGRQAWARVRKGSLVISGSVTVHEGAVCRN